MFLGGLAFIVGSIMDTLDGRYSRMSGKGTPFGAFLDSTLDRAEEGIVLAAVLVWEGLMFLGGLAFIVGSIMDTLDGRYSRMSGKGTPFGAFLDSTLDRAEEGIVLAAVAGYFALHGNQVAAAAVVIAVLASLMVSYTRARAEALGVECKVGIATRPVRVVILSIGLVFAKGASLGDFELLEPAVYVLATLSVITVAQRVWHVRGELSV
jgi:CDP-diacylglycerol--glycerol-3-phosphate 3-phosphatidyltransferase